MKAFLAAAGLLLAAPALAQERDCPVCPELALVPPGSFVIGTPAERVGRDAAYDETPQVIVTMTRPFYVSVHEITVAEFRRYVEATATEPEGGCRVLQGGQWVRERDRGWRDPGFAAAPADDEPVVCVSWDDARAYADWLSRESGHRYRLPSEAEWEYAARGGTSFPRYWGEFDSHEDVTIALACDYANVYDTSAVDVWRFDWPNARCDDRAPGLTAVGRYRPNAFGIHEILGNAREWVADCYTASYLGRPVDGRAWTWQGGCERVVVRGGSWVSRPRAVRAAARDAEEPALRQADLGFRVVREFE
ncbi:MAG: formylglycine-generating enzyme family protein [Gammaproteobacteria bacterium]|nr:formylglycine-generating enzyme family protein [Gammaproteobacteria bacterium]